MLVARTRIIKQTGTLETDRQKKGEQQQQKAVVFRISVSFHDNAEMTANAGQPAARRQSTSRTGLSEVSARRELTSRTN